MGWFDFLQISSSTSFLAHSLARYWWWKANCNLMSLCCTSNSELDISDLGAWVDLNHDANSKRPLNSNSSHRLEPGPGPGCIIAPKMRLLLPPSLTFHKQAIRVGDGKNEKKMHPAHAACEHPRTPPLMSWALGTGQWACELPRRTSFVFLFSCFLCS